MERRLQRPKLRHTVCTKHKLAPHSSLPQPLNPTLTRTSAPSDREVTLASARCTCEWRLLQAVICQALFSYVYPSGTVFVRLLSDKKNEATSVEANSGTDRCHLLLTCLIEADDIRMTVYIYTGLKDRSESRHWDKWCFFLFANSHSTRTEQISSVF